MYGPFPEEQHWRGGSEMSDFYHLKGVMQAVFGGRRGFRFEKPKHRPAFLQEGAALVMKLGAGEAGVLGLADPMAVINSDLKDTQVYYFEISLAALAESWRGSFRDRVPQVRAVSAFPAAWRDLSVLVDEKREWSELEKDLGSLPDLSRLDLIDVYKGKGVPEGQRSLTLRFTFSSMERTFTDADVNSRMEKALKKLEASFGARLRG
jgi:phenylalanyl-tRNA synthetase beta chain